VEEAARYSAHDFYHRAGRARLNHFDTYELENELEVEKHVLLKSLGAAGT
jgi:hypothetical protein